jgi:hypothetical protein
MVSHLNKSASIVLPSLDLARVYSVLAYYLTSRETIDAYLAQHELSKTTRQELQARHSLILAELRWCIALPACAHSGMRVYRSFSLR